MTWRAVLARWRAALVLAGGLLVLAWQAAVMLPTLRSDAPYEAWDEVATYNGARVLSGPTANWVYRYGTLDTFIQIVANQYFLAADPYGAQYPHANYSNNDYASLNDPYYVYRMKPGEFGFNYFRGIDDHRSIALARDVHFFLFYGLAAVMMIGAAAVLGPGAFWLILPLLCLTAGPSIAAEAFKALPNAVNAVLSFIVVALLGLGIRIGCARLLYLAAAALAVAINFKIDLAALGPALGLALLWYGIPRGTAVTLRTGLAAGATFAAVLIATNPLLVVAPGAWLKWLVPPVDQARPDLVETVSANLLELARALRAAMLPDAWLATVPTAALPPLLVGVAIAIVVLLRRRAIDRLIPPALAAASLWLAPVLLVAEFYPRYALSGLGAFYAFAGLALLGLWRDGGRRGRIAAAALAAVLAGQYGMLYADDAAQAAKIDAETRSLLRGDDNGGYDSRYSRTIIEWRVTEAAGAGGFDRTVLVDQHAYLDLEPLRRAGLNPVYVNIDTLDAVLAGLDRSVAHLVIYSPGSYATDPAWWRPWMTKWPPALERRYDDYLAKLAAFPVLSEEGTMPQRLLSAAPVEPSDRMVAAIVPAAEPPPL